MISKLLCQLNTQFFGYSISVLNICWDLCLVMEIKAIEKKEKKPTSDSCIVFCLSFNINGRWVASVLYNICTNIAACGACLGLRSRGRVTSNFCYDLVYCRRSLHQQMKFYAWDAKENICFAKENV